MEILETLYGNFNIYLNLIGSNDGNLVHISFVDKRNKTHIIVMQQLKGKWNFQNPGQLPDWIMYSESQLVALINKRLPKDIITAA